MKYNTRLEYVASQLPCMPCDVDFTFSVDATDGEWAAIGFKELNAAYVDWDLIPFDLGNYWGMATSNGSLAHEYAQSPLSGRILAGYQTPHGTACGRELIAPAYVGYLVEPEHDGFIQNLAVTVAGGRTSIAFRANFDAGATEQDLNWQIGKLGVQRVMWAVGPLGGDGSCDAAVGTTFMYHNGARGLTPLNFPGMGTPCR